MIEYWSNDASVKRLSGTVQTYGVQYPFQQIDGKLRDIIRDDVIQFARDNGIRRPDAIIRDVVESLKHFRMIAEKYGVSEQWTGRVEATIISHLKAWDEWQEDVLSLD